MTEAVRDVAAQPAKLCSEVIAEIGKVLVGQEAMIAATGDSAPSAYEHTEMVAHIRTIIGRAAAQFTERERTSIQKQ